MIDPTQPRTFHRMVQIALAFAAACLAVGFATHFPVAYQVSDGDHYVALAQGHAAQVMRPFAFRVLNPWLAAHIARVWSMPLPDAFRYLGMGWAGMLAFCIFLLQMQLRRGIALLSVAGTLMLVFVPTLYAQLLLPDLSHAALLAAYLLLLRVRMWWPASFVLVLLYLARESTLLLAVVATVVLWQTVSRKVAGIHGACAVVAMFLSRMVGAQGAPNQQGMNDTLYLIGKVPWNLVKNLTGAIPSTDSTPAPGALLWTLPRWLQHGNVHAIGFTAWQPSMLALTFTALAAAFGLGTLFAVLLLRRFGMRALLPHEPWLRIAAVYGAICFVLAPGLGSAIFRLTEYSWPLFLLWLPYMLDRAAARVSAWRLVVLLVLHFGVAWNLEGLVVLLFRLTPYEITASGVAWRVALQMLLAYPIARGVIFPREPRDARANGVISQSAA